MSSDDDLHVPIAELVRDPLAVLRLTADSSGPVLVGDGDEPAAVLMSPPVFARLERERELLRRLALGELEAAADDGFDLDEVLEEADLLLEDN